MEAPKLAVSSVYALIFFLAYSSQWLLKDLEPEPPTSGEYLRFNILLICLLISYTRSVFVDPGRIPTTQEQEKELLNDDSDGNPSRPDGTNAHRKWCRKCNLPKPPRAHHCRTCGRCIPKMDHHCPWTANCVSHTTFPHFLRFLFYAVVCLMYLASLLWPPVAHLWNNRNMPSYLGPTAFQLAHLFALCIANFMMLFALGILLARNIWALAVNTTTIEGWEIERHETLVRRARYFGGWLEGPGGVQVRIEKQEFPYDVGIWRNCREGMGTSNILAWFWPLTTTPRLTVGLSYPTNGFSDLPWPPPDPDRLQRTWQKPRSDGPTLLDADIGSEETIAAFRKRQEEDLARRSGSSGVVRRKPFVQRIEASQQRQRQQRDDSYRYGGQDEEEDEEMMFESDPELPEKENSSGEEAWCNSEGERLRDFGVDEDLEFYDEEDDIPLSELLAKRREGL